MSMLLPSRMALNIMSKLMEKGFNGTYLFQFASAIGTGSITPFIGKTFTTNDVGLATGFGTGTGTGIFVNSSVFQSVFILNITNEFGVTPTEQMLILANAIGESFELELKEASLHSNHSFIFNGNGVVNISSINISSNEIKNLLIVTGMGLGLNGSAWVSLANSIANALEQCFFLGMANVSISGSPNTIVPFPSTGSGTGILT